MSRAEWFAVDWGTSHLRVWPMDASDRSLGRLQSDQGMGVLTPQDYEATLLALLEPYIAPGKAIRVVCCGMAGSRQGWSEAPYVACPCPPPAKEAGTPVATRDPRLDVTLLPGVMQLAPSDVMRGEETQIAGVLSDHPGFEGTICLPGTHTKWVSVSGGRIEGFVTFLTGELFHLLSRKSVLRHSLSAEGWSDHHFAQGLAQALHAPEQIAAELFRLRADALLADLDPVAARSLLSGLLLGLEIGASRSYWRQSPVIVVAEPALAEVYRVALTLQGVTAQTLDAERTTLSGLVAAYRHLNRN